MRRPPARDHLLVSYNMLTGTITDGIQFLTSLQVISDNTLTGTILDGIRPITSLQIISDNRLMDTITDGIQSLTYLFRPVRLSPMTQRRRV